MKEFNFKHCEDDRILYHAKQLTDEYEVTWVYENYERKMTYKSKEVKKYIEEGKWVVTDCNKNILNTLKITKFNPPEKSRIYQYPVGEVELKNVTELIVRPSGTHRLKTQDGKHHIIPKGWIHIELDIDNWSV